MKEFDISPLFEKIWKQFRSTNRGSWMQQRKYVAKWFWLKGLELGLKIKK